jgi:hypothetical protein
MESKKSATNVTDLLGHYQKSKSQLHRADLSGHLIVTTRKTTTSSKPPKYLLYKTPERDIYVSSMYPQTGNPDTYKIEWKGQIAFIQMTEDSATITPLVTKSPKYINRTFVTPEVTPTQD